MVPPCKRAGIAGPFLVRRGLHLLYAAGYIRRGGDQLCGNAPLDADRAMMKSYNAPTCAESWPSSASRLTISFQMPVARWLAVCAPLSVQAPKLAQSATSGS